MRAVRISEDIVPVSEFKAQAAECLRRIAETDGVTRREGRIATVERDGASGDVAALVMEDGGRIDGDLFIDCTGFRALLIEQALAAGFEDWGHWLPTDAAWAVPSASIGDAHPYTRAIAHPEGWRWRIPLQHRMGNGLVFSTAHVEPEAAMLQAGAEAVDGVGARAEVPAAVPGVGAVTGRG